ncbi:MAG: alcohol dehydrogenase catalytic domain-containing protein [Thaumarchaeota archaeon]|nr:alcohol dehydrogenase catalytic domain-containing protein [Nitrososphaerota archaeon]MDD9826639.1 alcohol dehydrogenase catalytic domain-containing protein [Nitrososphaerota archaeon]RNJ72510.1 MAG: zinc-binding alcohol dehydrogenase [Thaumarchaeota archaeon S14]RNJ74031.1 MAG: zinc-binding alcohol dehydrogenase [Thaumarchaeota archaeon S13]RNJ76831.1 MAG: zinc-binding alcohol dehydrogenase [Thaumarchaeota archaeon S15]
MAKMRAMVLSECAPIETSPLRLTEIDRHEISRPQEVLVRIEACGVCHSQLHGIEGDWRDIGIPPALPTVPGHEVVGTVVEAGKGATAVSVGERVGISPLLESCLDCGYCNDGKEQLCESMDVLGESLKGGYAEYVTVADSFATRVPASMRPEYAAPLFCAGVTAYGAVRACGASSGDRVGVFGVGGVGHMAVQFARRDGLEVTAVSRSAGHLGVASRLGADRTVQYDGADAAAAEAASRGALDAAMVFAPAGEVTGAALKSVKRGGTVVVATVGGIPDFLAFEEKTVRGTLIGSRADMAEVVRIAHEDGLEVVHETFPLEGANEALRRLKESRVEARAVLVP